MQVVRLGGSPGAFVAILLLDAQHGRTAMARRKNQKACKQLILSRLRAGETLQQVAAAARVALSTVSGWRKRDRAFDAQVRQASSRLLAEAARLTQLDHDELMYDHARAMAAVQHHERQAAASQDLELLHGRLCDLGAQWKVTSDEHYAEAKRLEREGRADEADWLRFNGGFESWRLGREFDGVAEAVIADPMDFWETSDPDEITGLLECITQRWEDFMGEKTTEAEVLEEAGRSDLAKILRSQADTATIIAAAWRDCPSHGESRTDDE